MFKNLCIFENLINMIEIIEIEMIIKWRTLCWTQRSQGIKFKKYSNKYAKVNKNDAVNRDKNANKYLLVNFIIINKTLKQLYPQSN